ncbi:MAG: YeeE/YedE family protein [Rhodospirillales bacterium]
MTGTELRVTPRPQYIVAGLAVASLLILAPQAGSGGYLSPALMVVGTALGIVLYHAAFGFTAAYRRWFVHGDRRGVRAQLIMLAAATLLFAPTLGGGEIFGHAANGIYAPLGLRLLIGAFLFGIGMQLGGGCGSGTLFTAGGGSLRMVVTLVFFCAGSLWATLDMAFWESLPAWRPVSLMKEFGWLPAAAGQLCFIGLLYWWLRQRRGEPVTAPKGRQNPFHTLLAGPWPLIAGALLLAALNWLTLALAGHPWTVTWGFAIWGAKTAALLGWDPATSVFWSGDYTRYLLEQGVLTDHSSIMDIGILIGAMLAAALAGQFRPTLRIPPRSLAAAIIGGLMLGYGARVGFGCNIGAFFSGVASMSLHGWGWILAALAGCRVGIWLRPLFGLAN